MNYDLFDPPDMDRVATVEIVPDTWISRCYLGSSDADVMQCINDVLRQAPLRQMTTAMGGSMSVTTSSCGELGWVSDSRGYRYADRDPVSGRPWPKIPDRLRTLAQQAAEEAGFGRFDPDACLINCYRPGAKMGLHQDRDERDRRHPIVSLSLGLPATFVFGGFQRSGEKTRIELRHGDLLVWGGRARMRFHGVLTLKRGWHPLLGEQRINLTFRKAG